MRLCISVIGGSECTPEDAAIAHEVGASLAERGVTVICGGLGGVMEAVCRGARSRDGLTVGLLPGNDVRMANRWVSLPIATGVGQARNIGVVRSSAAVIAIGGAHGTLTEIAFALDSGIPVVGLGTWRVAERGTAPSPVREAATAIEAVELALRLATGKE